MLGEDVLITGAGPIGIMAAAIAEICRRETRRHHRPQRVPSGPGQEAAAQPEPSTWLRRSLPDVMAELGMKEGFDVGLEMSGAGSPRFNDMIDNMKHGGKIALLGLQRAEHRRQLGEQSSSTG